MDVIGLRWVYRDGEKVLQVEKLAADGVTWEWVDIPEVHQKRSEVSETETLP